MTTPAFTLPTNHLLLRFPKTPLPTRDLLLAAVELAGEAGETEPSFYSFGPREEYDTMDDLVSRIQGYLREGPTPFLYFILDTPTNVEVLFFHSNGVGDDESGSLLWALCDLLASPAARTALGAEIIVN